MWLLSVNVVGRSKLLEMRVVVIAGTDVAVGGMCCYFCSCCFCFEILERSGSCCSCCCCFVIERRRGG